jgi:hypothetical protein
MRSRPIYSFGKIVIDETRLAAHPINTRLQLRCLCSAHAKFQSLNGAFAVLAKCLRARHVRPFPHVSTIKIDIRRFLKDIPKPFQLLPGAFLLLHRQPLGLRHVVAGMPVAQLHRQHVGEEGFGPACLDFGVAHVFGKTGDGTVGELDIRHR